MAWGLVEASAQWGPMNQSSLVIVANASLESGILVASVSLPFSQCWIKPQQTLAPGAPAIYRRCAELVLQRALLWPFPYLGLGIS